MELLDELDEDSVCEDVAELEKLSELVRSDDGSICSELDELEEPPDDMDTDCNDEDNSASEDDMNDVDVSDDMGSESDCTDDILLLEPPPSMMTELSFSVQPPKRQSTVRSAAPVILFFIVFPSIIYTVPSLRGESSFFYTHNNYTAFLRVCQ